MHETRIPCLGSRLRILNKATRRSQPVSTLLCTVLFQAGMSIQAGSLQLLARTVVPLMLVRIVVPFLILFSMRVFLWCNSLCTCLVQLVEAGCTVIGLSRKGAPEKGGEWTKSVKWVKANAVVRGEEGALCSLVACESGKTTSIACNAKTSPLYFGSREYG